MRCGHRDRRQDTGEGSRGGECSVVKCGRGVKVVRRDDVRQDAARQKGFLL